MLERSTCAAVPVDVRRQQLQQWMTDCRAATLALFAEMDDRIFRYQAHADFSPVGWHLGHIAYTESLWILQHCAQQPPDRQYQRLFVADGLPKTERQNLPPRSVIQDYLSDVRERVFAYLETAPLDQDERLWRWLLQHESQHNETIVLLLQLLDALPARSPDCGFAISDQPDMVPVAAGFVELGSESLDAIDNERPMQRLWLPEYWIDRYPVTCEQYREFMAAGGYRDDRHWSEAGWAWLQQHPVSQPLYWTDSSAFDRHPVCGVSWYEAEAYANFVGKRLPTEAEWEKAARFDPQTGRSRSYPWGEAFPTPDRCNHSLANGQTTPVNAHPLGDSAIGCADMLGNVWEWTADWFAGYPGFTPYPYKGYSQTYFDHQHRVLRGGSWATRPWALRCSFRNWYHPHVRQILAGFRCAMDR